MRRVDVGENTLAACETCGRYVDAPLAIKKLTVVQFDHRQDFHPAYPARFRPLVALLDPTGEWDVIIRSTRPTPPGRRLK